MPVVQEISTYAAKKEICELHSSALGSTRKFSASQKIRDVLFDSFNPVTMDFLVLAACREKEAAPHNITCATIRFIDPVKPRELCFPLVIRLPENEHFAPCPQSLASIFPKFVFQ